MQCTEVTNTPVLPFRRSTEVSRNLQETNGGVRKSPTTCGKPPEEYGSPVQLVGNFRRSTEVPRNSAGNQLQLQEVSRSLQEIKCSCRKLQTDVLMTKCSCRKSPTTCRKQNAIAGSLLQLAGNQMQFSIGYLETVMVSLFFFCWMCTVLPSPKPSSSSHFPLSRISGTVMR